MSGSAFICIIRINSLILNFYPRYTYSFFVRISCRYVAALKRVFDELHAFYTENELDFDDKV